jgi:hypothetical protein
MTVNNKFEGMWMEMIAVLLKVLPQHLHGLIAVNMLKTKFG